MVLVIEANSGKVALAGITYIAIVRVSSWMAVCAAGV
jgi:hypothetical protein